MYVHVGFRKSLSAMLKPAYKNHTFALFEDAEGALQLNQPLPQPMS